MLGDDVLSAHERATERFVALVASMPEPPRPVPGLAWSTSEVAAHVLSAFRGFRQAVQDGTPLWADIHDGPAENQRRLEQTPERHPADLARELDRTGHEFRALMQTVDRPIAAWGSLEVTPDVLVGTNLGDVMIHGLDISRALGSRWVLDPGDAVAVLSRVITIIPAFVNVEAASGFRATYGLTLRPGPSWGLTFEDGVLTVQTGRPARADCRLLASPVGFLLSAYGRQSQLRTALTGQVIAYGRKPWLAGRFNQMLLPP